ncbi:MAG: T9SS type A sorting domain-containing protein, partial [Saprospiraceae bacterium]
CKTYGNTTNANYNIKTLSVAMRRIEMLQNLLYTVPGPKMMWQFGELGYDYTINYCPNGTVNTNCRVDPKPIRWDYLQDPYRRRLHDVTAALLYLRNTWDVFETSDFNTNIASGQFRTIQLNDPNLNQRVFVMANIGTTTGTTPIVLPTSGWWYEYYTGDSVVSINNGPIQFTLSAGEYRLYTNRKVPLPPGLNPTPTVEVSGPIDGVVVFPNPATNLAYADVYLRDQADLRLSVVDALGRMVYQQQTGLLPTGDYRFEMPMQNQAKGIYFVKVETANGMVVKRLIIH